MKSRKFQLTRIARYLGAATGCALYAVSANAANPCTAQGINLGSLASLTTIDLNVSSGQREFTDAQHECDNVGVANPSTTLLVDGGGTIGNATLSNGGTLTIGPGGEMWGYALAGGSINPQNTNGSFANPQVFGAIGHVKVEQGGILATALIGPNSTLDVIGTSQPTKTAPPIQTATVGRIETSGTVNIDHGLVDISDDVDGGIRGGAALNAIAVAGGSVNITDSTVRSRQDVTNYAILLGALSPEMTSDHIPIALTMTNSTITDASGGILATQLHSNPAQQHSILIDLTNTTINSNPDITLAALAMTQSVPDTSLINASVTGGTLTGGVGVLVRALDDAVGHTVTLQTHGTTITAPNAAPSQGNDSNVAGAGVYVAGPAQILLGDGTIVQGAADGLRIGSDSATTLAQGPAIQIDNGSRVEAQNGAALHVTRNGSDPLSTSNILVSNGSSLVGQSGQAILVDSGAQSNVMFQNSTASGAFTATGAGSALTTVLQDSTATGNLQASGGATLAAGLLRSSIAGNASSTGAGSSLTVELAEDASVNGNIAASDQASVNVVASQSNATVNGGISADNATANVSLTNGGKVTGGIQLANGATGRIAVDGSGSALSSGGTALNVAGGSNAELQISNGALLSSASALAVDVTGNSQANVNVTNADVTGSLLRDAGSTLNVTLDGNTTLTGATNANTLNISNGALWNVGDATQSNVGTLDISNGRVDMNSGTGPFKTLKVGALQGSGGTFTMGVDFIPGGGNDLLTVSGNATGTHVLDPYGEDQGVKSPRNNIVVTQIGSGDAAFSLSGNGRVDAGIYTYTLEHQGNEWVLVRDDDGDNNGGTGGGGPDAPPATPPAPDTLSPAAVTALNTASALPFVWNNELGTLRQRQGDLRDNRAGDGLWVRPFSSFDRIDQMAAPGYDLNQYGMLIGADKRLPVQSGDLYVGGFGSYSYSQVDPRGGSSGRINSYGLGAYATWMGTNGWYVDSVVKANSFQSDLRVVGSNGRTSRGNYTTPGIGASVEVGKTIPLWDKGFMEPYGKLSAFAARGSSEKLDNNFDIDNGAQRSVQAEAGVLAGHRFDLHDGRFIQPYIKMGLAHEFIDDNRSTLNGTRFTNDISGTRVIGGVGVSAQLKQNLQMHVDVDYSTGGPVDRAVTVNAGLRYVF